MKPVRTPIKAVEKKKLLAKLASLTAERVWDAANLEPVILDAIDQLYAELYPTEEDRAAITHQVKRGHEHKLRTVSLSDIQHYWYGEAHFREKHKIWEATITSLMESWRTPNLHNMPVKIGDNRLYPSEMLALSARFVSEKHLEVVAAVIAKAHEALGNIDQVSSQFMTMASAIQCCKTLEQIIELSPDLEDLARSCMASPPSKLPAIPVEDVRSFLDTIKPLSKEVA